MALAALPGMGPVLLRRIDAALDGGAEQLLTLPDAQRRALCPLPIQQALQNWQEHFAPERVAAALDAMNADFVTCEDPDYPEALAHFPDRPIGLYRYRKQARIAEKAIAIVGTRNPSAYGRKITRQLTEELSGAGYQIISGMAEGIDTDAHRAALQCGGSSAAFLGGGLKRCYPRTNRLLMEELSFSGGVWSEFPLWRNADRRSFPQRNRIVAGVSEAVVVIESGAIGGSLITARMAAEQGRPVYVVPGRIDAAESAGCHALIRDGAQLITCAEDILADLSNQPPPLRNAAKPRTQPIIRQAANSAAQPQPAPADLSPLQAAIWSLLNNGECLHPDQIARTMDCSTPSLNATLLDMELEGWIWRHLDGRYERL